MTFSLSFFYKISDKFSFSRGLNVGGIALDFAFSKNVRAQDMYKAISFVFANPAGRDLC